ncbi:MAG TPA: cupredoxin domain-containing protein [Candidatus Dormibacteraeota bacterium]
MTRWAGIVGLGAAALLAACGGTNAPPQAAATSSSSSESMSSGSMSSSGATSSGAMSMNTSCAPAGTTVKLTAKDTMFDVNCIAVPAGQAITVTFDNEDGGIPHNLAIYAKDPNEDPNAKTLFKGELVTGVTTMTYNVPALTAGTYHFHCDVHPQQMFGAFVVK